MKKVHKPKNGGGGFVVCKPPTLNSGPPVVNVSFDSTQEVAAALRALRDTGLFGVDCAAVAEGLLRRALLDPTVLPYWRKA